MSSPTSPSCSSSPSSVSSKSKQRTMSDDSHSNDETRIEIKIEQGTDEVKIFSASTLPKHEVEDDVDIDGIEDRLSPVVVEPTSPNKADSSNHNHPGLYSSPFLYPYFHPMWNPYLMAAAAQAHTAGSTQDKTATEGQANSPYGATSPFPGMSFPGLYHPGMGHPSFQANLFNPFNIPIPSPGLRPPNSFNRPHQSSSASDRSSKDLSALLETKRPRKPHIKKPLNAFMIYMKEQRARVIEECTLKESSAINKVLGQKWKELSRSEQDRYYELAKEERNRHMQMYPGWSARDNYGIKKKRPTIVVTHHTHKKLAQENHNSPHKNLTKTPTQLDNDCSTQKKCRARYGLEGLSQWCKHCRRKKKCTRFLEDDQNHPYSGSSFNQGNPSSVSSPAQSDNDDSINDLDSDDILSRQIDSIDDEHDDSDEENHQQNAKPLESVSQQFHPPPINQLYPAQFFPGFSY